MKKVAVFVSGSGTNLQALIDAQKRGNLQGKLALVVSDKKNAYGLERAVICGIPCCCIGKENQPDPTARYEEIISLLDRFGIDLIVLAGYLGILPAFFTQKYAGRIINLHPALLPKYGGKGFYGDFVHKAVLASGDVVSGATVHYVNEGVDTGANILQEEVPIEPGETLESLKTKIHAAEHRIIVDATNKVLQTMV